jgi:DNA-binding LacI/PurR family transcriptional regulator
MDKTYASYSTIRYLVELGHRRIGFICNSSGNDQTQYDCEKFNGYMRALADSGIPYDPTLTVFAAGNSFKAGYDAARHLYRRSNVTAIYGPSDLLACGAMNYYLSHGVKIPEQVSFAGNDSTELAAYAPVPLTSSLYQVEELTDKAIELLMDRIDKVQDAPPFPQRIVLKSVLEVRASTAPCVEKEE